jgi:hypothetical protein
MNRLPTPRQWRFAALRAAGVLSLADCYRAAYPRAGLRNLGTLYAEASRLARHPAVLWAVARIQAEARGATRLERLQTRARAAFAEQIIREAARRTGRQCARESVWVAEHGKECRRRDLLWRLFAQAVVAIGKARGGLPVFVPPEERTRLIFDHYAPVLPPLALAPLPERTIPVAVARASAAAVADGAELDALVHMQRTQRARSPEPEREPAESGPQPGCFPPPMPAEADAPPWPIPPPPAAGHWEERMVPGHFPPQRRRVWIEEKE